MKKKNESGKTNSTRETASQPQKPATDGRTEGEKADNATHELAFKLAPDQARQFLEVARANGQTPQQLIEEAVVLRLRAEAAAETPVAARLRLACGNCNELHNAMLRAVMLLELLPRKLFEEFKARQAPEKEIDLVKGLCLCAEDAGALLKSCVAEVYEDVTKLSDLQHKPA